MQSETYVKLAYELFVIDYVTQIVAHSCRQVGEKGRDSFKELR